MRLMNEILPSGHIILRSNPNIIESIHISIIENEKALGFISNAVLYEEIMENLAFTSMLAST